MGTELTREQAAAVARVDGDLVIRAGAGSGKTTVLARRFVQGLEAQAGTGEERLGIDRVLTITFTAKAAAEIAERVRRQMNESISADAGRQVGEAWISTIHRLCGRLVRRHALEADVEPGFSMADEAQSAALRAEAFELAATRLLAESAQVGDFFASHAFGSAFDGVCAIHDAVRAMGRDPSLVVVPSGRDELADAVMAAVDAAERFSDAVSQGGQTDAQRRAAESSAEYMRALSSCELGDREGCARVFEIARDRKGSTAGGAGAKAARDELKAANERVKQVAASVLAEPILEGLRALIAGFSADYSALKAERGLLDFDDLQERARDLLQRDGDLAKRYREHFRMIMVDEFQDTNELQMTVLGRLRNDDFCVVGDERQSIYGFRYAETEVFERVTAESGPPIQLRHNFRSHPEILAFINHAFSGSALFGPGFMRLEAGRVDGWTPLPEGAKRVEAVLVDIADASVADGRRTEARLIAEKAAELVAGGRSCGDIAVLVRGSSNVPLYAEALERAGLPAYVSAGERFHEAPEVIEMLALLRVIALPSDDDALLGVVAGRLARLSDDTLFALRRLAGRNGHLFDAMRAVAEHGAGGAIAGDESVAVCHAYAAIQQLRVEHESVGLSALIHRAIELFDYDLTVYAEGARGVRAWANLMKLARFARAFEQVESSDPGAFVEHMRQQRVDGSREGAAVTQTGAHAVRIMTIHGSKGLEFPIVFVADLAAAIVRGASRFLVGPPEDGAERPVVGLRLPDGDAFLGLPTPGHARLDQLGAARAIEEEKRCLYVACTRAQEMLVLSGARDLSSDASEPKQLVDWARLALGDPTADGRIEGEGWEASVRVATPEEPEAEAPGEPLQRGRVWAETCAVERPVTLEPRVPETVSYSALHVFERCPYAYYVGYVLGLRKFEAESTSSATAFGSATHSALQSAVRGAVASETFSAVARRFALDAESDARMRRAVEGFLGGSLGARVAGAERVGREQPLRVDLGGTSLVGNVDVIAWEGSRALVVDYKTGKPPAAERQSGYELQARCYALAALRDGASEVEVAFAFVEHGEQTLTLHFSAGDAETIEAELRARVADIEHSEFPHLSAYDASVCEGCGAVDGLCPIDSPRGAPG